MKSSIHWFRKGLRLHDNPSLMEACSGVDRIYPIFIIDPWFANPEVVGVNRYAFLLEALRDLDTGLRRLGTRLYVLKGKPELVLPDLLESWNVTLLTFESDTEPYAVKRDEAITKMCDKAGIRVSTHSSHTLHNPDKYLVEGVPKSYQGFNNLFAKLGPPRRPIAAPTRSQIPAFINDSADYNVPELEEMNYPPLSVPLSFPGGETEALRRLEEFVSKRPDWVATFEKPNTSPNALSPSTTVLSPYLKFGCLSASLFYHTVGDIISSRKGCTVPPVSLHGQLLWREYFYANSVATPNFDKMVGNPNCKQIPWDNDPVKLLAWKEARTGFPFIDAIMTQLRTEGWIHHLARHAVACFLTRGDLWQSWEAGAKVFDLYLLDADWALNNANWQWLSCSNFFYQYFRCYSPVAFGKKTDPTGKYIRKWLPQLANIPDKYIFEPWLAPKSVQQTANCIIGIDYPNPIVSHEIISKQNIQRMKCAYDGVPYDSKSISEVKDIEDCKTGAKKRRSDNEKDSTSADITSFFDKKKKK